MSGHSKWSTIKRAKGITDIKRSATFTKIANVVTIAVKLGGSGDPDSNPRLRMAIDEARSVNMPKENIQRAIDRGLGKGEGNTLEEVLYEGFGPGAVAIIVEGVTDNKMRTTSAVKNIFEKGGGSMAGVGAVSYMFERVGVINVKSQMSNVKSKEDEMLELIDLGAEDVEEFLEPFDGVYTERSERAQGKDIQKYLVYTEATTVAEVGNKITQAGFAVESQSLVYKPTVLVEIKDKESVQKVLDFIERLEELDDVQKVYVNFDIEEQMIS